MPRRSSLACAGGATRPRLRDRTILVPRRGRERTQLERGQRPTRDCRRRAEPAPTTQLQRNVERALPHFRGARELERSPRRRARTGRPSSTSMRRAADDEHPPVARQMRDRRWGRRDAAGPADERAGRRRDEWHGHLRLASFTTSATRRCATADGELEGGEERDDHRVRTARAISRSASRCFSASRLSCSFFPLPSAIATFATPRLK